METEGEEQGACISYHLDKFTLFETLSNFYMIGRDIKRKFWRVLKIDRSKPSELSVHEDPTTYSGKTCKILLDSISEGNKPTGGLKLVTNCYGIIGFIKLLETYYILIITERKEIGRICNHPIYSISQHRMIPISHSTALTYMYNSSKENRCKKLLQLVDIKNNFFFSRSYPLMYRLQQNLNKQGGHPSDNTMFVWNEYLTHQIRQNLKSTLWTVALIHGFFKQVELSTRGKTFTITLIARRSCRFAGTRYEKRGVDENGQAANDVEIEQIVWPYTPGEFPAQITSVVQNRGSIPLRWWQKPSLLHLQPDIFISEDDDSYKATRLHFQNLRLRYGTPIVILSLIKKLKKKHREYLLHGEFQKAVVSINKDLVEEDQMEFLSLDLDEVFKNEKADEISELKSVATTALRKIGFFSCQMPQSINFKASFDLSYRSIRIDSDSANSPDSNSSDRNVCSMQQNGILRTNCLDSLDRTNFAQYVYGLVALGHQLHNLGIIESNVLDFEDLFVHELMNVYQTMGDSISQQYGGSPAHQKIFSKAKGQFKVTTQFQELTKSIQRHCNNSFLDVTKQQAIDLFLGNFKPEVGVLNPLKRKKDQDTCGWLNALYLKNKPRCNICIYSGFERLRSEDDDADKFGSRCLKLKHGGSQHESPDGYALLDFSAAP